MYDDEITPLLFSFYVIVIIVCIFLQGCLFIYFFFEDRKRSSMSTPIVDEPLSESYEFANVKNEVIVTLYANGAFEIKDIDISIDTDKLDVRTPGK